MAGEEEGSMESRRWMLTPCTAATKRKAVPRSSYKDGDPPPVGWIDVYALAEPASSHPFESQRRAAAIDKMLQEAKLPAAPAPVAVKQAAPVAVKPAAPAAIKPPLSAAPPGGVSKLTRRLTKGEIRSIIALKPEPFPSADYLDDLAQFDPPESIAEKRRQHDADAAYFGDRDEKYEGFRQRVIRGLKEDGYYEVDADYIAARDKANQRAIKNPRQPFAWMDPSDLKGRIATPADHQRRLRQGCYRRYVPDAEDALLISYGQEDSMSDDKEEGSSSVSDADEDTEAKGHRGAPIEAN